MDAGLRVVPVRRFQQDRGVIACHGLPRRASWVAEAGGAEARKLTKFTVRHARNTLPARGARMRGSTVSKSVGDHGRVGACRTGGGVIVGSPPVAVCGRLAPPRPSCRTGSGIHRAAYVQAVGYAVRWTPEQVRGDGARDAGAARLPVFRRTPEPRVSQSHDAADAPSWAPVFAGARAILSQRSCRATRPSAGRDQRAEGGDPAADP